MDLGAAVVANKQPLEVVQPGEGALDNPASAPRPEPCSVWRRAISGAVPAHASTPPTRNRHHRAFMPCPSSERLRPSRLGSIV
jgi:hypothetical protein